jgi:hypothetical protein
MDSVKKLLEFPQYWFTSSLKQLCCNAILSRAFSSFKLSRSNLDFAKTDFWQGFGEVAG